MAFSHAKGKTGGTLLRRKVFTCRNFYNYWQLTMIQNSQSLALFWMAIQYLLENGRMKSIWSSLPPKKADQDGTILVMA